MDPRLFEKLIDELKNTVMQISLYFQGEPFLNRNLAEAISYANRAGIYTETSTNGQFPNKNNARRIVLSGLNKLIVSVDGATQEVYAQYRIGGSLEKALETISEIAYWKKELKSVTPIVEMQFIVLRNNEHQIPEIKKLAKNSGANSLKLKTARLEDFESGNSLMPTIDKYSRYKKVRSGHYRLKTSQPNHCWRLWSGAVVNASGEVLPCCFDKASEFPFGNIKNQTFAECWQSKSADSFRKKVLESRKSIKICSNCTSTM